MKMSNLSSNKFCGKGERERKEKERKREMEIVVLNSKWEIENEENKLE